MSHSLGSKVIITENQPIGKNAPSTSQKRGIVISVARDTQSKTRHSSKETPSLGLSTRHIEAALGTIAPKAVLTLPSTSGLTAKVNKNWGEDGDFFLNSHSQAELKKSGLQSVSSSIPVKEIVRVGLPGIPGVDDEMTIRRRKPMPMQQLIQNHVLLKPGINISDSPDNSKFSALEYYGCREEPLDELLLTTFHLIIRIPVQAAADIIVDMPDWMRKKFLLRFKLPALINEVLSSRIDDYEQPEDDSVAVAAEVVWSNALAAGSMAENAATFFPPRLSAKSSLNRLVVEGASRKLKPQKDFETALSVQLSLPTVGAIDSRTEDTDFEMISARIWNDIRPSNVKAPNIALTRDARDIDEGFEPDLPSLSSPVSIRVVSPVAEQEHQEPVLTIDSSKLLTDHLMDHLKDGLNAPRSTFAFDASSADGIVRLVKESSLTLPLPPKQAIQNVDSSSLVDTQAASIEGKKEVSIVRLDNGNLVLL